MDQKIAEIARQLCEAFPGFDVQAPSPFDDLSRCFFRVHWNQDLMLSKNFTVPLDALDELQPGEIVAFVEATDWWKRPEIAGTHSTFSTTYCVGFHYRTDEEFPARA